MARATADAGGDSAGPAQRRRRGRALRWTPCWLAAVYVLAVGAGMPPALPFDVAVNLGGVDVDEALRAPADGRRRLVVLQHGLWRTSYSLWRLERALVAHGYEVLDPGYPSTAARVEQHAQRLRDAIEARLAARGPVDELYCVGHSMGGLVIEEYLRRADARPVTACVYVATPHRGAVLSDLRKHWWLFRLVMGDAAALQLSPGDPLFARPIPTPAPAGTIVGDLGDGNSDIPGRDDGTVGVAEATFAGACDTVDLPLGHTAIAAAPATIRQVLHFLRWRRFAH